MEFSLKEDRGVSKQLLLLITFSTAFSVANIYYSQPLLETIRDEFKITDLLANSITIMAQVGYALGLFFIVPLGDMFSRKRIIVFNFSIITLSLLVIGLSSNIYTIIISSFIVGFTSVTPQIFLPLVSQFSTPNSKGKNVGIIVSGLLIGILSSRVISGFIGDLWGWRTMYYAAAGVMLLFLLLILYYFPTTEINFKGRYKELMLSLFTIVKKEPKLLFAATKSGLAFGSFLSLWAMLAFKMAQYPFYANSTIVGLLGLCGIAGALSASFLGKHVKSIGLFKINFIGTLLMISAWLLLFLAQTTYIGIILGIIILDIGMQCIQLGNQTAVLELRPKAINRINTVFMTCYFIGGATGTFLAGIAWSEFEWLGVFIVGASLAGIALFTNSYQFLSRHSI